MDKNILKILLASCESAHKNLEPSEVNAFFDDENAGKEEEPYCIPGNIRRALSVSLSYLISCKVSQQMHQRHTIQQKVYECLRECVRIPNIFSYLDASLKDIEISPIVIKILKKHLAEECFDERPLEMLIQLSKIIFNLIPKDDEFKCHWNRILISITKCQVVEVDEFLANILKSPARNHLNKNIVKIMYTDHARHLIEKPLTDDFFRYVNKLPDIDDFQFESCATIFHELIHTSKVFRLASVILKEIFVKLKYAKFVVDFSKLFLNEVKKKCDDKRYLRLYPNKLQPCVILMKIEPTAHTRKSKELLFDIVNNISLNNNDDLIILLMHFPSWLDLIAEIMSLPLPKNEFFIERMDCS